MDCFYEYLVLLPYGLHSMHELREKINNKLSDTDRNIFVEVIDECLIVNIDSWKFRIYLNTDSYVQIESKEIAEKFAVGRPDQQQISQIKQRIETLGDIDLNLDYLNDVIFILESWKKTIKLLFLMDHKENLCRNYFLDVYEPCIKT